MHATPAPSRADQLPALDGLRALAVVAVLIYHANPAWLPGGFLGVEVFFVLSGFLITRGLAAEWRASGRVDLRAFWLRRARRLLPALLLFVFAVLVLSAAFDPAGLAGLRTEALAGVAYLSNWQLILEGQSYFDSWFKPSPLRHLWSLAVEGQFYVVWPLIVALGLTRLGRRFVVALALAGAAVSALLMALLYDPVAGDVSRIYYGSDTRLSGLLLGAALALAPLSLPGPSRFVASVFLNAAALAALGLLVGLCVFLGEGAPLLYRGGFLVVGLATAALIVLLSQPSTLLARALALAPLRWLGMRSYGVYLWHWPILLLAWPATADLPLLAGYVAATLLIASFSYRFVEEPVRRGALGSLLRRRPGVGRFRLAPTLLAIPVAVPVVAGIAVSFSVSPPGQASAYPQAMAIRLVSSPAPEFVPDFWLTGTIPTQEETPAEAQPPNRADCAAIRGTDYLSPQERDWFLASCLGKTGPVLLRLAGPIAVSSRVTALGDSVMLGGAYRLAYLVPGIDVDAAVGRQAAAVVNILKQRLDAGELGDIVLLHIGNNGTLSGRQLDEIMAVVGPERRVLLVTLKVPRSWQDANNRHLAEAAERYANVALVDWQTESSDKPELFGDDLIHLNRDGALVYADLIAWRISELTTHASSGRQAVAALGAN